MHRKDFKKRFLNLSNKKTIILDGALGTTIQSLSLSENEYRGDMFKNHDKPLSGNIDILNLTQPNIVERIHDQYIETGADIITTNSFNASAVSQEYYGTSQFADRINYQAANIANKAVSKVTNREIFTAGSMGPTAINLSKLEIEQRNKMYNLVKQSYYLAAENLIAGGVDIILLETVVDIINLQAALEAVTYLFDKQNLVDFPLWISFTPNVNSGRLISGETVSEAVNMILKYNPFCIGLNCGTDLEKLAGYLEEMKQSSDTLLSFHPSASLITEQVNKNVSPVEFAEKLVLLSRRENIDIVGGCCGSGFEHINMLSRSIDKKE